MLAFACITGIGAWLLMGASGRSAALQAPPSVQYMEGNAREKERAYSPAVVTRGGRIIWLAGQTTLVDANGKSLLGDFQGQARAAFALIDSTLKRSGGSLRNLVTMTVFITDPRFGDEFVKLRHDVFPDGKFPASALISVSGLAQPGLLIEIQGIAVIPD